ncbi:MAG: sterol desaturase family protein [Spirochaetota bacterium]|nr:sterol desaturase family protein [Spirochaetota bacterium]
MNIKLIISFISFALIFLLETISPHYKDRRKRFTHAANNLSITAINNLLYYISFSSITLMVMNWAQTYHIGLNHLFTFPSYDVYLKGILIFLLFDLWMYFWHRINHRIRFFWKLHRTHHSDIQMDITTALRFHPFEILLSSLFRLIIFLLLGMNMIFLLVYEIALQVIIQFHHSNISLPEKYDRLLRYLIVTPNMHRVHHSDEWSETNSNYSSIFSFWDRLWSSFRKREDTRTINLGLKLLREDKWQRITGILLTPFR